MQNWGIAPPFQVGHKVWSHKGYVLCVSFRLAPTFGLKIAGKFEWRPFFFFFCRFSPYFRRKIGLNSSEAFFCSSPNFGQKIELILGGTISDSDLCSSQIFWSSWPPLFKILRTLLSIRYEWRQLRTLKYCQKKAKVITLKSCLPRSLAKSQRK